MLPLLIGAHYREWPAIGLITSAGSLCVLLPPSLPLILFALVAKLPLEEMFLAAVFPGLLMAALLLAQAASMLAPRAPRYGTPNVSWPRRWLRLACCSADSRHRSRPLR